MRLLGHTLAFEAMAEGCSATALTFNMHASVVMPLLDSAEVTPETKRYIADLVVGQGKLIAGNFSEPGTTSLVGSRPITAQARRSAGGWRITARKMFASMTEAADYGLVLARPEGAASPFAGVFLLVARGAQGRRVDADWDTLACGRPAVTRLSSTIAGCPRARPSLNRTTSGPSTTQI